MKAKLIDSWNNYHRVFHINAYLHKLKQPAALVN
jgi:hypothetical protein